MRTKKGMGAFLVATLVILILIFIVFALLSFISKSEKDTPELINFVNRNYYQKDLLLVLDSPTDSFGSSFVGLNIAEFTTLHFLDLKAFEKKISKKLDVTTLTDTEKAYYSYFTLIDKLAVSFCSKYKEVSSCSLEISTFKENKKITLTFPHQSLLKRIFPGLNIRYGNTVIPYTLAETNFYGPDGSAFTIRSKLEEPLNRISIEDFMGDSH